MASRPPEQSQDSSSPGEVRLRPGSESRCQRRHVEDRRSKANSLREARIDSAGPDYCSGEAVMSVKSVIRHSSSTQLISIRTCKTHTRGRKGAEWKITYFTYTTDKDGRRQPTRFWIRPERDRRPRPHSLTAGRVRHGRRAIRRA